MGLFGFKKKKKEAAKNDTATISVPVSTSVPEMTKKSHY